MKITKYEHACLVLEEQGKKLIIDPGVFSISLPDDTDNVVAMVITHVHPDHFDPEAVNNIAVKNQGLQIYSTEEVAQELSALKVNIVTGGQEASLEPFKLQFYGGIHAEIHNSYPRNQNVGIQVNDRFYYPGDSFDKPAGQIKVLALPVYAPWMKLSEAMDFLADIKPVTAIPTHNYFLSDAGETLVENILGGVAEKINSQIHSLLPGDSIEV